MLCRWEKSTTVCLWDTDYSRARGSQEGDATEVSQMVPTRKEVLCSTESVTNHLLNKISKNEATKVQVLNYVKDTISAQECLKWLRRIRDGIVWEGFMKYLILDLALEWWKKELKDCMIIYIGIG